MKTVICYYSTHHGNTRKLFNAIREKHPDVELINITREKIPDLSGFDLIGIYYSDFAKELYKFVDEKLPSGKKVFLIYTAGMGRNDKFETKIQQAVETKGSSIIGSYGCQGFDTFGPLKLVGGIKKGHPDYSEIQKAVSFYEKLS